MAGPLHARSFGDHVDKKINHYVKKNVDDDTSDTASDTADLSVDDDEQATVDDSESDDGDDSGGDGEGSSDGDDGGDDVVAVATDLQGRISAIVASVSILFVIYLLISAFSARGMSKRYAKTYGLQRMTMKQNVTWGLEVFANLMSAGLLGLAFDVLNPNSGQCRCDDAGRCRR